MAVAGGTGLIAVYQLARDFGNAKSLLVLELQSVITTSTNANRLLMSVATDDGSLGFKGFVTEMLRARLKMSKSELENIMFYNCGPAPMVTQPQYA